MRKNRNTKIEKSIIRILFATVMIGSILAAVALAPITVAADVYTISFLYEDSFAGVDPPTDDWSTDDSMVLLPNGGYWSLLNGTAHVYGYRDGFGLLTHRGTRGLGVYGKEHDEVDSYDRPEKIEIRFDTPHRLGYLEVRSLFDNEGPNGEPEKGNIDLYLHGSCVHKYYPEGTDGQNGKLEILVPNIVVDKIVYYVDENEPYKDWSEFAVAKLKVEPLPPEAAIPTLSEWGRIIFMTIIMGIGVMMLVRRRVVA